MLALSDDYYVRTLELEDIEGPYPGWFQDEEICRFNRHNKYSKTRSYFTDYVQGINGRDQVVWGIFASDHAHVGNVALTELDALNRTSNLSIILGDRRVWGKGVGYLACAALVRRAFLNLNLHKVSAGTNEGNTGMIGICRKLGMREEGRLVQHQFVDGAYSDVLLFGLLRDSWTG